MNTVVDSSAEDDSCYNPKFMKTDAILARAFKGEL